MNIRIPTGIGLAIIVFFAAIVLVIWQSAQKYTMDWTAGTEVGRQTTLAANKNSDNDCPIKVYAGEEKIKGWYTEENSHKVFNVSGSDLAKLPVFNNPQYKDRISRLIIVDNDATTEKKMSKTTEKNPGMITIRGFAIECRGTALASLNYKDGIFRPYLNIAAK